MKILAIGDFHGSFDKKFEALIKKEKIDVVVSVGDYPPFAYGKLWFKHCFGKDVDLWDVIGKKKYKELVTKDHYRGERVFKKLNELSVPVFTIFGNADYPKADDVMDMPRKKKNDWNFAENEYLDMGNRLKKYKNITRFDYSYAKLGEYVFIGMRGHSFPGRVKSKAYKKHRAILDKLFKKFNKENKAGKVIFVSHVPPKDTKIDKIGMHAHPKVAGTHRGSKLARRIIETHQPIIQLCGHVHESWGTDTIGKTLCVNTGAAHEGMGAIVILTEGKKPKVTFIK